MIISQSRSRVMASIKSRGNRSTGMAMVSILRSHRFSGWRRHVGIVGTPDCVWPKLRIALFVDGCFWHGCNICRRAPKSNETFWNKKLEYNVRHDRRVNALLRKQGWQVIRIRECQLKSPRTIRRLCRLFEA
ncbi:MAG: very short patch repair endonuclease [bacterium]|nr:very short patch repair endonuclease [bacterium]